MPASSTKFDRYNHSAKGIARRDRHHQTERYRATNERFYANHGGQAAYWVNWYHRVQDEAGCHMLVAEFYPGYRFLQALVTAEVVEV